MIARRTHSRPPGGTVSQAAAHDAAASTGPVGRDVDEVMLELLARDEALRAVPVAAVRLVSAGEHDRQFVVDGVPVGSDGFTAVCAALDTPAAFLRRAPLALGEDVVEGMKDDPEVEVRELMLNAINNTVVGHRVRGQESVPSARVFERVFRALPDAGGVHLHQTSSAVEASVVCRKLDIEPKRGDVVRGGLTCRYSEVGPRRASIRAYSERLVCTNGMTHREFERVFGLPEGLATFLDEVGLATRACYDYVSQAIESKMRRAAEFEVNGPQAIRRIFNQAHLPPKYMDAVLAAHLVEDDGTMFGVLQSFTRAANTLKHDSRTRFQLLAGDELTVVEKAHCPSCYASM